MSPCVRTLSLTPEIKDQPTPVHLRSYEHAPPHYHPNSLGQHSGMFNCSGNYNGKAFSRPPHAILVGHHMHNPVYADGDRGKSPIFRDDRLSDIRVVDCPTKQEWLHTIAGTNPQVALCHYWPADQVRHPRIGAEHIVQYRKVCGVILLFSLLIIIDRLQSRRTLHKIHTFVEAQQDRSRIRQFFRQGEMSILLRDCNAGLQQALEAFQVKHFLWQTIKWNKSSRLGALFFQLILQRCDNTHRQDMKKYLNWSILCQMRRVQTPYGISIPVSNNE